MKKAHFLSHDQIKSNILAIKAWIIKEKFDGVYVSSSDIFLNEYVPLIDCQRYYFTGFTGSTAEVFIPSNGKVQLYVDGRYFEQADLEVDLDLVQVNKVEMSVGIKKAMLAEIKQRKQKKIAANGDRLELSFYTSLKENSEVCLFSDLFFNSFLKTEKVPVSKKLFKVDESLTGETTLEKLKRILGPNEAMFISSLDSIAWLTNYRRFDFPNQSTFSAKAFLTNDHVYLLMEDYDGEITDQHISVYPGNFSKLNDFFDDLFYVYHKTIGAKFDPRKIFFDEAALTASDYQVLLTKFGETKLEKRAQGLVPFHSVKNSAEISAIKSSFDRADQAIFNTINWAKKEVHEKKAISELDFYNMCNEYYKNEGAIDQSFKTISAFGANSSIIHFGSPSDKTMAKENDLALLDSGGYFKSGYATDTTRTFLLGKNASDKQKEIYTLVLKGFLNALNAVFPVGTIGAFIDGITRQPMHQFGYNYNHGTGHGVGINVHEGGFRISPASTLPLKENTIGSIEPGIYLPGFGGVRLENIVLVKAHPQFIGMLCFENLVWVGFDHDLINLELLSKDELVWLSNYESECEKRGRSFKYAK